MLLWVKVCGIKICVVCASMLFPEHLLAVLFGQRRSLSSALLREALCFMVILVHELQYFTFNHILVGGACNLVLFFHPQSLGDGKLPITLSHVAVLHQNQSPCKYGWNGVRWVSLSIHRAMEVLRKSVRVTKPHPEAWTCSNSPATRVQTSASRVRGRITVSLPGLLSSDIVQCGNITWLKWKCL